MSTSNTASASASTSWSPQKMAAALPTLEQSRPRAPSVLKAPWLRTANAEAGKQKTKADTAAQSPTKSPEKRREVRRMPSLYSTASIATTQEQTGGASTFEYDVDANLRRQQQRRRRNHNNSQASTSTQTSHVSYAPSFSSYVAQGEFIRAPPSIAASSVRRAPRRTFHDEDVDDEAEASTTDAPQEDAVDMLQRVRRDSVASRYSTLSVPRKRGGGGSKAAPIGGTLSDTLEHLIANSVSYRGNGPSRSRYGTFAGAAGDGHFDGKSLISPTPSQQRMPNSISSKSLAAFAAPQLDKGKQAAVQDRIVPSASLRSGWGSTLGNAQRAMSLWAFGGPQPAPTMSGPLRTGQATIAMPSGNAVAHGLPAYRTRLDAADTLRDLRSLLATGRAPATAGNTTRKDVGKAAGPSQSSPQKQRQPRRNGGRATLQALYAPPEASNAQQATSSDTAAAQGSPGKKESPGNTPRRAFAALDPTSHDSSAHGHDYVTRPRLSRQTTRSSGHLSNRSVEGRQSTHSSLASPPMPQAQNGAMPALDPALARAEAKSGLSKRSTCSMCSTRVVNAPMTRSGEVFCSRECRVAMKQKNKAAAQTLASPDSSTSQGKTKAATQVMGGSGGTIAPVSAVPAQPIAAATSS